METGDIVDIRNERDWLRRIAKSELPPVIITVAITGGMQGKEVNPALPESPEEQSEQTCDAYKSGASIVHIHARKPDNLSETSSDPKRYREINGMIREKCPEIIINNSTGGGPGMSNEERMASLQANPEMASLNMGPTSFRTTFKKRQPPLSGRPNDITMDYTWPLTFGDNEVFARAMFERNIKPEMEVYNPGNLWMVHNVIDKGLVKSPYFIQFVMGFQLGIQPTPKNLVIEVEASPMPSLFNVAGLGPHQITMTTMALLLGLNVRVGLEDNNFYRKGELCTSNAQQVERVVRLARELGRRIATPREARQMLGLSEEPSRY